MPRPNGDNSSPRKKNGSKKKSSPGFNWKGIVGGVICVLLLVGAVGKFLKGLQKGREAMTGPAAPEASPLPATGTASGEAERSWAFSDANAMNQSKNNLRQIGLALENYHLVHMAFPASSLVRDTDQVEYMSWSISLLPFIDQSARYNAYNPSKAWNSTENQPVTGVPIAVYANPVFNSTGPVSHFAGNSHLLTVNTFTSRSSISDGASNTFVIGEVSAGFKSWADPSNVRDLSLGLGTAPDKFGGTFKDGSHILMADGEVRFLSDKTDPSVLKAIATPAAGDQAGSF